MGVYNTGVIYTQSGSTIVSGYGTSWNSNINVSDIFIKRGGSAPFKIASVDSDTQIQLTSAYPGPTESGLYYDIFQDFTPNAGLAKVYGSDRTDWAVILGDDLDKLDYIALGWNLIPFTCTFVSASGFTASSDKTSLFIPDTRMKIVHGGGTSYYSISSATYNSGTNKTTITMTSGGIQTPIAQVYQSIVTMGSTGCFPSTWGVVETNGIKIKDAGTNLFTLISSDSTPNYTTDRTLTIDLQNASKTLTLQGSPTLDDWFNQAVKSTSSPTFINGSFTGDVNIRGDLTVSGSMSEFQDVITVSGLTVTAWQKNNYLTASRLLYSDADKKIQSVSDLASWVAGTTNRITVTNDGDGSITLNLPQDIHTEATPSVNSLTASTIKTNEITIISGLTAARLMVTDGSKKVVSSDLNSWVTGTASQIIVTDDSDGTITLTAPQNIAANSNVSFNQVTSLSGIHDQVVISGLSASRLIASDSSKNIVSIADLSSWIAGTSNQITVTNDGDGSITVSLPQSINTTADVSLNQITSVSGVFNQTTISGLTASLPVFTDANKKLVSKTAQEARTAILPSQTGQAKKFMTTDGTDISFAAAGGGKTEIAWADHGFSKEDVITFNPTYSGWIKSLASGTIASDVVGIVSNVPDTQTFEICTGGFVDSFSGKTPGAVYFLSDTTSGLLTVTEPSAEGAISKPLFIATTTSGGFFFNWRGAEIVENSSTSYYQGFTNSALSAGVLTITHNLGHKFCQVQVSDNTDKVITPDEITFSTINSLLIDLSSFGSITGTWNVTILDFGSAYNNKTKYLVEAQNTGKVLTTTDLGQIFTCSGTVARIFTLPSIDASNIGDWFGFMKLGTGQVTVSGVDSDLIEDSGPGCGIYCNDSDEAYLELFVTTATKWNIKSATNIWTTTN
jgi:hypothetical protein